MSRTTPGPHPVDEELRHSPALLRAVADHAAEALFLMDAQGRVTFANPAAERMFGWSAAALRGRVLHEVIHDRRPDGSALHPSACPLVAAFREGRALLGLEDTFFHRDGRAVAVECSIGPIEEGGAAGAVLIVRDVTDRKQAERERDRLLDRERAHAEKLRGLTRASIAINAARSVEEVLRVITEQARAVIGAHQAVSSLATGDDWAHQSISSVSMSDRYDAWRSFEAPPDGSGIYSLVCRTNRTMRLTQDELEAHPAWRRFGRSAADHPPMRGWLASPLIGRDGSNLGLIQLSDKEEGEFDEDDEAILVQLSQMASIAVENARLYEQAESSRRALIESESRYRTLTEAVPQLVWICRPDGSCAYLSRQWDDYTGMPEGSLLGQGWVEVVHPDDRAPTLDRWRAAVEGEADYDAELRLRRADGAYRWFKSRALPQRDEAGAVTDWFGTCTDIDDQKQAERALREGEARLRQVADNLPGGVIYQVVEAPGGAIRFSYLSAGVEPMLGVLPDEAMADRMALYGRIVEEDRPRVLEADRIARYDRSPFDQQFRIRARDGRVRWVHCRSAPRPLPGGGAVWDGVMLDLTERRAAEDALRLSEARFGAVVDHSPMVVFVKDLAGRYQIVNHAFERATGQRADRVVGRHPEEVFSPEFAGQVRENDRRVIESGRVHEFEEVMAACGEARIYLSTKFPLLDPAGRPYALCCIAADITDRKQAERELREARDAAEAASKARDHFLAALSHELRTPLMPVLLGVGHVAADPRLPDDLRDELATIRRNVELEARLIDDLLDLTRITQDKLELRARPVDVHGLIRDALGICRSDLEAKGLGLSTGLGAASSLVVGDAARLQQVLWNLLKNAVKFTPPGGRIAVTTSDGPGGRLRVEVRDSGIGMPAEVLPTIFDAFEQGGREVTRRFGGLGLGLAISRALAEAHGGTLSAESPGPGLGATFALELPDARPPGAPSPASIAVEGPGAARPLRILLVEDNPDTARILARLLAGSGHAVTTARGVSSALTSAGEGTFDLLISDLGLPDGSGLDLMMRLRPMPGIALTGFGMEDDVERTRDAGFRLHLTKPVDFDRLESAIRMVFESP